ncbi:sensor domain-containing diguanylate cyclase [Ruminococcus flavefaciens]|uniref:sensor domain-containing diguanylate cyclase n=1 Tax=Ruminococcus flavefaciens TaxID=1265 RepID=UPI00036426C7|nr:sensor domain-containing diguanylate cyclase [Ruminococcus flavefaciens]
MHSLRTRLTVTMLCVILAALVIVTLLSAVFIRRTESYKTDQLLLMLCESGERSLDYYFDSVQNSVLRVTSFAEEDLEGMNDEQLEKHVENIREYFGMMASKTKGVLTYYYRIDPSVSSSVKGFWYTNLSGDGFIEHEVTDITQYDVEDTSKLVWFTVPKHEGRPIWLPPYITDNLDVRVISYDAPVFWKGNFIGVVGIEVDYSIMAEEVDSIRLYENGYAFLSDADGKLFYHPHIDVTQLSSETTYELPFSTGEGSTFVRYTYKGEEKLAVRRPLSNGMRLNVTVPFSEAKGDWQGLILNITLGAIVVLVAASLFLMLYTRRITKPLEQLTEAAEQVDKGNYDFTPSYNKDDELGRLTRSFKNLSDNVKAHISDLSGQVFIDALTHIKNKGAFSQVIEELQENLNSGNKNTEFAIGVFDCDSLKVINDRYGHDKGDLYLKTASRTICDVFKHSPVFRMGGDEFAVILKKEDFCNMEALLKHFDEVTDEINASAAEPWKQVHISKGFAVFDPTEDTTVIEVIQRADN